MKIYKNKVNTEYCIESLGMTSNVGKINNNKKIIQKLKAYTAMGQYMINSTEKIVTG